MVMDGHTFAYKTVVWQCFTKSHVDLFQGDFDSKNTYNWRYLRQFTTKINWAELDGNL